MASISVGGHGGRKALDSPIPLVPFIDLLLCCVMFLLVTAVWNDLAGIEAAQRVPAAGMDAPETATEALTLAIRRNGVELSSLAGDRQWIEGSEELPLKQALVAFRKLHAGNALTIAAEDGVAYAEVIRALDLARAVGFRQLDVTDSSRL
jgi:biopolymer transport protein ExbD